MPFFSGVPPFCLLESLSPVDEWNPQTYVKSIVYCYDAMQVLKTK